MFPLYALLLRLGMIATASYLVADMSNLALKSYLSEQVKTEAQQKSPGNRNQKEPLRRSRPSYRSIVQKNIFNSASEAQKPALAQKTKQSNATPVATQNSRPLKPLNLTLIGTAVSATGEHLAVVKKPKEKRQSVHRLGDQIAPGAKIIEISRNQVVLLRGTQREVLTLKEKKKKGAAIARRVSTRNAPSTAPSETSIRKVSEDQWVLDKRELDDALKNLPKLLTQARVVPTFKDGKPDGFRIFAIAKDSLYAKIGLQNGDILHRINGVDVKNPQNFMKVVEDLKDQDHINVDLVRNNDKETFSYEIR